MEFLALRIRSPVRPYGGGSGPVGDRREGRAGQVGRFGRAGQAVPETVKGGSGRHALMIGLEQTAKGVKGR